MDKAIKDYSMTTAVVSGVSISTIQVSFSPFVCMPDCKKEQT
jgi:hypothetical protein